MGSSFQTRNGSAASARSATTPAHCWSSTRLRLDWAAPASCGRSRRGDVLPDIVTVGKGPAGSYYPIAFCTWRQPHDRFFRERPLVHTSSYAGSDIGCIVALAVLDQVTEPGFLEHVQGMGARLARGLGEIDRDHPGWISAVRGRGLMFGIEGPHGGAGFDLSRACLERGVLAIAALNRPSTMQLMPPLIVEAREIDEILAILRAAVAELSSGY